VETETVQKPEASEFMKAFFGSERRWKPKDLKQLLRLGPPSDNATKEELKRILQNEFSTLGDDAQKADGPKLDERLRGYRLERLLFKLFFLEGLNPHPSFERRPKKRNFQESYDTISEKDEDANDDDEAKDGRGRKAGSEQIDGFFELDDRFFLLEAKWTKDPIPASALYTFRGAVEGRLGGTVGLFVSVGDFADDAEYALMWGKEICMLLANESDIACALEPGNSFTEMIRMKLREAARLGEIYTSYREHVDRDK
jgi:hypothetical protein